MIPLLSENHDQEMRILHIETSTKVCSVALSEGGGIVFEKVSFEGPSHASLAGLFVEEALLMAKGALDAVAVSAGPGSYTGLRIGISLAKGLCVGAGVPLIAVPTLELLASEAVRKHGDSDCLYCAMMDARRMEVYAAIYDARLHPVRETMAEIVTPESYASWRETRRICFFGDGATKCQPVLASENAVFLDGIYPLATAMAPLAEAAFLEKRLVDTAYFEPLYLKEFIATPPKNKVLGK